MQNKTFKPDSNTVQEIPSGPIGSGRYHISYKKALNPAQQQVVFFGEGPLLVIAGAGSGKTRTLTYRVARLVEDGVSPRAILLLTFTRKASYEMLMRAAQLLDNRCEHVAGGTFHSFANAVLRKHAAQLKIDPGFAILDRADAEGLIGIIRREMSLSPEHRAFPRKQTLADIFSKAVNKVLSVEDVIYNEYPHFIDLMDDITPLHEMYIKRKIEHNFLDYDDLLVYLLLLLQNRPAARQQISSAYRYIMVDEYQDTNLLQAEIVSLLADTHQNVMVVGDDSQSIYSFRGAHFKNIIKFPELFSGTRIIRLEENYRSVQPVLDLANAIIDRAAEKYTKVLFTRKTDGAKPVLAATRGENSQSRFIVEKIEELHSQGLAYSRIAVLFRASFHSFDLEIELGRQGVPFIKVGGFKFVEAAHIKDHLAHLKVLANPHDRISWYRILMLLNKIGPKTAQKIFRTIVDEKRGVAGLLTLQLEAKTQNRLEPLKSLLAVIDSPGMSVTEKGQVILNYYESILTDKFDDHPRRMKDLEHLVTIMERYSSLDQFLNDMALEPPNTSVDDTFVTGAAQDVRLVLSTIHSAKGLEWHTVFVIWALEGRFPAAHFRHRPAELEEELRLMYVAATRAQAGLFFTYPTQVYDRSSGTLLNRPSRFIDQIPGSILTKTYIEDYF